MKKALLNQQAAVTLSVILIYLATYFSFANGYKLFIVVKDPLYFSYIYDFQRLLLSIALVIFFSVILSFYTKQLSHLLLHVLFVLPFVPMAIIYGFGGGDQTYFFVSALSFLIVILVSVAPISLPDSIKFQRLYILEMDMVMWLFLFSGVFYSGAIIYFGGLKFLNFNIWKVYEFRELAAQNLPDVFNYLTPIISKAVLPILLECLFTPL